MPPKPLLLAFDTSAAHCAVALLSGQEVLAARVEDMHKGQAERLFVLLEEILTEASKSWTDLDGIGVGIGPGNFTGIRLSVSAARGLALSLDIPAIGVSTLEALAFETPGRVLTSVDARRDQVYGQVFENGVANPPALYDLESLQAALTGKLDTCIGHNAKTLATALGATPTNAQTPLAVAIARIAAPQLAKSTKRPAPLYLKAADAAPSRDPAPVILS